MTTPLTTFHLFPSLPKELQLSIWRMALREPRVVTVHKQEISSRYASILPMGNTLHFSTRNSPPPLMNVCADSRAEAMSVYTRAFSDGTDPRYTYINFDIDTVIIDSEDLWSAAPEDRMAIRHLVILIYDFMEYEEFFLWGDGGVMRTESLQELTVVGKYWAASEDPDNSDWDDDAIRQYKEVLETAYKHLLDCCPKGWVPRKNSPKIRVVRAGEEGSFGAVMDKYTRGWLYN